MVTKTFNINSVAKAFQPSVFAMLNRLGWCYDLEDDGTVVVNVPFEDKDFYDFTFCYFE